MRVFWSYRNPVTPAETSITLGFTVRPIYIPSFPPQRPRALNVIDMEVGFFKVNQKVIEGVDSFDCYPWYNFLRFTENRDYPSSVVMDNPKYFSAFRDFPEVFNILADFRPRPGMRHLNVDYFQAELEKLGTLTSARHERQLAECSPV
jgi:hypothetical protein